MNAAHIHLLVNHLPVIGALIGILLLAIALARHSDELSKVTFGLYALLGAASVVVYLTGEPAEDAVENLAGISETMLESHEESALVATIALGVFGALALLALILFRRRALPGWAIKGGLVMSLLVAALMGYTASLGGQIRHSEIRAGASSQFNEVARQRGEKDEEH